MVDGLKLQLYNCNETTKNLLKVNTRNKHVSANINESSSCAAQGLRYFSSNHIHVAVSVHINKILTSGVAVTDDKMCHSGVAVIGEYLNAIQS